MRVAKKPRTPDLGIVALLIPHEKRGSLAVERVGRVRVAQELREENVEDVDHVEHGRPRLVDHVEADRTRELIDVGCKSCKSAGHPDLYGVAFVQGSHGACAEWAKTVAVAARTADSIEFTRSEAAHGGRSCS